MHELALMESVVDAIEQRIERGRVVTVRLAVGRLAAVVPDALRFCFDVCTKGTIAEGAALEIRDVPGRATCLDCGAEAEIEDLLARCACGSARLSITSGEELRIQDVEVI